MSHRMKVAGVMALFGVLGNAVGFAMIGVLDLAPGLLVLVSTVLAGGGIVLLAAVKGSRRVFGILGVIGVVGELIVQATYVVEPSFYPMALVDLAAMGLMIGVIAGLCTRMGKSETRSPHGPVLRA